MSGCSRQALLSLVLITLGILVFSGLVFGVLWLSGPDASPNTRGVLLGIAAFALFGLLLAGVLAWGFAGIRSRARLLDAAFAPAGLSGRSYGLIGRQYHGLIRGRPVDAYLERGPTLEIYVASNLGTRMAVGTRDDLGLGLARTLNQQPLEIADPNFRNLSASTKDETWTRDLLADPHAREILLRLAQAEGPYELRHVVIQPDALVLRLVRPLMSSLNPANLHGWTDDLLALARIAETLPPPRERLEPSRLERNSRTNRGAFLLPAFGLIVAILAAVVACPLVVIGIVAYLNSTP